MQSDSAGRSYLEKMWCKRSKLVPTFPYLDCASNISRYANVNEDQQVVLRTSNSPPCRELVNANMISVLVPTQVACGFQDIFLALTHGNGLNYPLVPSFEYSRIIAGTELGGIIPSSVTITEMNSLGVISCSKFTNSKFGMFLHSDTERRWES